MKDKRRSNSSRYATTVNVVISFCVVFRFVPCSKISFIEMRIFLLGLVIYYICIFFIIRLRKSLVKVLCSSFFIHSFTGRSFSFLLLLRKIMVFLFISSLYVCVTCLYLCLLIKLTSKQLTYALNQLKM